MGSHSQAVWVLEAEAGVGEGVRNALAAAGIDCEVAGNAVEIQKAIEERRVAVVLLDVATARPDALELLERLLEQRPPPRVIALAGAQDQPRVLDALRLGACDYLALPIHAEELRLAVRRAQDAHAIATRWESARERLHRLADQSREIERAARRGEARQALAARVVGALSEVLDAGRTSLLRLSDDGEQLRVEALQGRVVPAEDLDDALVAESVSGIAVRAGHALLIDDIDSDPRCEGRQRRPHYQSSAVALAPLFGDDGVCGVLCATEPSGGDTFRDEDLALLRLLAQQADRWLEARAEPSSTAAASMDDAHSELLREVCEAITRELEPEQLLAAVLEPVARACAARSAALYLVDAGGVLKCEARSAGAERDRDQLPRDAGLTARCLASGEVVAALEPAGDPRFDPAVDTPESGRAGPLLLVPLQVRHRVLGVARVFPGRASGATARLGELLAAPLSAATRNVLLYRSLLESVEDLARARREAGKRGA